MHTISVYYLYHYFDMRFEQCISVTELRRKTGSFIGKGSMSERFVFVGSKPTNVILSMERYEALQKIEESFYEQQLDIRFVQFDVMSASEKKEYDTASKRDNSEFVEL